MAVSAASAMSLKRSISSLDLAADARAARARRSAQPSNKEGLEDPTLETPLKDTGLPPLETPEEAIHKALKQNYHVLDTGLPPSSPAPPIDGLLHPSMKQYMARPDVKAKKAEYMKQYRRMMKSKKAEDMKQYMTSSRHLQSPLPAIAEVPGLAAGEGRQAEVGGPPHRKNG